MSAATVETPPDAGKYAVSGPGSTGDDAAATGPQRSLEASSFLALGGGMANMDAAFEALPAATILAYGDGSNLHINARARELLHLSDGDRVRSLAELVSHANLASADGKSLVLPLDGEAASLSVKASFAEEDDRRWVIDASPIVDNGARIGVAFVVRDVTDGALDDEMGDDLLGRASHDLRTPLTALKASAQLIGRGFERLDEHARQRTLGLLLAQIDKLATRIDDVMDASRIRRGRIDLHPENLDLAVLLREVVAEIAAIPGMPRCELRAPETLPAHGDGARVRQIVKRLTIDAASRGTDSLMIEAAANGDYVNVTIAANGATSDDTRHRTARRLATKVFERLGGSAREDRARRLVLSLPRSR